MPEPTASSLVGTHSFRPARKRRWSRPLRRLETFGSGLTFLGAGAVAGYAHPDIAINDLKPAGFLPGATHGEVALVPDHSSGNFLGNEFLLWLWYQLDGGEDTVELPDSSDATVMFARTLLSDGLALPFQPGQD